MNLEKYLLSHSTGAKWMKCWTLLSVYDVPQSVKQNKILFRIKLTQLKMASCKKHCGGFCPIRFPTMPVRSSFSEMHWSLKKGAPKKCFKLVTNRAVALIPCISDISFAYTGKTDCVLHESRKYSNIGYMVCILWWSELKSFLMALNGRNIAGKRKVFWNFTTIGRGHF